VPLEVTTASGDDGPIVLARPPHSRWNTGVLPGVHMSDLVLEPWDRQMWRLDGGVDDGR
jgi:hypothetical protein